MSEKYAVVMLCMLKDHYVLGACIAAYVHKKLIPKKKNIELVIMCDDFVYDKHHKLLEHYFDKVINIKLHKYEKSEKYQFTNEKISKKYDWIVYSTNKWQCLKLIQYKKVLFIDIDILPISKKFYDIFDYNTPGFHFIHRKLHRDLNPIAFQEKCINNNKNYDQLHNYSSFDDYVSNDNKDFYTLNAGLVLLKPNKKIYNTYISFLDKIYENGMYSHKNSGPDETSLFYFYCKEMMYKKFYHICIEYLVIPWGISEKYINKALGYNFLSYVKPWLKPIFLSYDEELIWRTIYDNMPHKGNIEELFKLSIIYGFNIFNNTTDGKNFNYEYMKILKNDINLMKSIKDGDVLFSKILKLENKVKKQKNFGMLKLKDLNSIVK